MSIPKINIPIKFKRSDLWNSSALTRDPEITLSMSDRSDNYTIQLPLNMGNPGESLITSGYDSVYWGSPTISFYTTSHRSGINPSQGTLIYDTDLREVMIYKSTGWEVVGNGAGGGTTFLDTEFRVRDSLEQTKQLAFECANITAGTTRTITIPDRNINLNFASLMDQSTATTANPAFVGLGLTEPGGSSSVLLASPALAADYTLTLPDAAGANGSIVKTTDAKIDKIHKLGLWGDYQSNGLHRNRGLCPSKWTKP